MEVTEEIKIHVPGNPENEYAWFQYVQEAVQFLAEYSWIYNFKNTNIFIQGVLQNIPDEWKQTLIGLSCKELNNIPYGFIKDDWPLSLKNFISEAVKLAKPRFPEHKWNECLLNEIEIPNAIKNGMSLKKIKEVQHMSSLISGICKKYQCKTVLDIGSGLGYLGQVLHHNFGFTVLGLECTATKTNCAKLRSKKGSCRQNVQHSTCKITNTEECLQHIKMLLNNVLQTETVCMCGSGMTMEIIKQGVVMVGLHCCGSLAPDMLKLFLKLPEVKVVICVGCCYHLMNITDYSKPDFPMSKTASEIIEEAKMKYDWLPSISGLRLGAQETRAHWALQNEEDHVLHAKYVAYRGVLQCFLNKENLQWSRPKRHLAKQTDLSTFEKYVSVALQNVTWNESERKQKLENLLELFHQKEYLFPLIEILTLLQVLIQPIWETVVIADRYIFLRENCVDSKLVLMCDELISPRNLTLCGIKS